MDIVYGPCLAIAGVKYALLLVDKKTRKCCLYALKDLKDSIKDALSQFILDVGTKPKLLRTDFDKKLLKKKSAITKILCGLAHPTTAWGVLVLYIRYVHLIL